MKFNIIKLLLAASILILSINFIVSRSHSKSKPTMSHGHSSSSKRTTHTSNFANKQPDGMDFTPGKISKEDLKNSNKMVKKTNFKNKNSKHSDAHLTNNQRTDVLNFQKMDIDNTVYTSEGNIDQCFRPRNGNKYDKQRMNDYCQRNFIDRHDNLLCNDPLMFCYFCCDYELPGHDIGYRKNCYQKRCHDRQ